MKGDIKDSMTHGYLILSHSPGQNIHNITIVLVVKIVFVKVVLALQELTVLSLLDV